MKPIEFERVETIPDTRLCDEHARKIEKLGGEYIRSSSAERTSKAGSLKRNYGGIHTSKRRNVRAIEQLKDEFDDEKWKQKEAK
jgi:hypothetical protein